LAAEAINDYLGELEGKPVLPEVAQRIQAALTQVT
jgi:GGDEF domain-containing protein